MKKPSEKRSEAYAATFGRRRSSVMLSKAAVGGKKKYEEEPSDSEQEASEDEEITETRQASGNDLCFNCEEC